MNRTSKACSLSILIGIASSACGKALPPPESDTPLDASPDAPGALLDATPGEATDAAGGADARTDSGLPPLDSSTDSTTNPDAADAGEVTDGAEEASDAEDAASAAIPCTETTSCDAPVNLGTLWAGVSGGINEQASLFAAHSDWYRVEVQQYPPPAVSSSVVGVDVLIQPPNDTEFDLAVYFTPYANSHPDCSQLVGSATGDAGANQKVYFTFPNVGSVLGWITVHVTAKSGTKCATGSQYWLNIDTSY